MVIHSAIRAVVAILVVAGAGAGCGGRGDASSAPTQSTATSASTALRELVRDITESTRGYRRMTFQQSCDDQRRGARPVSASEYAELLGDKRARRDAATATRRALGTIDVATGAPADVRGDIERYLIGLKRRYDLHVRIDELTVRLFTMTSAEEIGTRIERERRRLNRQVDALGRSLRSDIRSTFRRYDLEPPAIFQEFTDAQLADPCGLIAQNAIP